VAHHQASGVDGRLVGVVGRDVLAEQSVHHQRLGQTVSRLLLERLAEIDGTPQGQAQATTEC
jgi:hypothetical protein